VQLCLDELASFVIPQGDKLLFVHGVLQFVVNYPARFERGISG